jgi:hypothetical protein
MFDLERSITEWRREMLAAGIKTPVPLEELESHLREEIQQQMQLGLDAQKVFENAVKKIGQANLIKSEFQKTNTLNIERIIAIVVALPTIFIGLRLTWLAIIQSRDIAKMTGNEVLFFMMFVPGILGIFFFISGMILVFYGGNNASWLPNARHKRKYV